MKTILPLCLMALALFFRAEANAATCSNVFDCSSAGNLKGLRSLIASGHDDSATNSSGQTPLDLALLRHHTQVIEFLVNRGAAHGRLDVLKMRRLAQYILHAGVTHFVTASKQCPEQFKHLPVKTQKAVLGIYHMARTDMGRWTLANSVDTLQLRDYLPRTLRTLREIHRAKGLCAAEISLQLLNRFDITR